MIMATEIIVALIGLGGSAIGSIIGIIASGKLTAYRLEQLENKVNKHNNLIERVYKIEQHNAVIDEELKNTNFRVCNLERRNAYEK
jgi:hypothetical protein